MSKLYASVDESSCSTPVDTSNTFNPSNTTSNTFNPSNTSNIHSSKIINNIENIISDILNLIDTYNYTDDDKLNLEKCLFNIQYKLKSPTIPTDIKSSLKKVKTMLQNLSNLSSNKIIGDLYQLNNCLLAFNDKLHQSLHIITNNENINTKKPSMTLFMKFLLYLFIISGLYYLFIYDDEDKSESNNLLKLSSVLTKL
jgi:hypothetical protein